MLAFRSNSFSLRFGSSATEGGGERNLIRQVRLGRENGVDLFN